MANNDRVSKALENVIAALQELKEAWDEQQAAFVPQVIISDEPPKEVEAAMEESAQDEAAADASEPVSAAPEPAPSASPVGAVVAAPPGAPGVSLFESAPAAPLPPQPSPDAGRKCPLCGAVAAPTSKFCLMCGASLGDQPANMQAPAGASYCKKCGSELLPGDRFCINCGTPV